MWGKDWLVKINMSETKQVIFHQHYRTDIEVSPIMVGRSSCLDRLLGLKLFTDLKRNLYIRFIAKDDGKTVDLLYCSHHNHLLHSNFTRARLVRKWGSDIISGLEFPSSLLREFKDVYSALWVMGYFSTYNRFTTGKRFRASRCLIAISIAWTLTNYTS